MITLQPLASFRFVARAAVAIAMVAALAVLVEARQHTLTDKKSMDSLFANTASRDDLPTGTIPKRRH